MNSESFKRNEPFCSFSRMVISKTSITEDDSYSNFNFIILLLMLKTGGNDKTDVH